MPTVTIQFESVEDLSGGDMLAGLGPTLPVQIGYDQAFQPGGPASPILPEVPLPALVDTGALECCIDSGLALRLGLPIVDRGPVIGVYGSSVVNYHLAQIYIPDLEWLIYGRFPAVHLASCGQHHRALLGRNFLQRFTLVYEGQTGVATIANACRVGNAKAPL